MPELATATPPVTANSAEIDAISSLLAAELAPKPEKAPAPAPEKGQAEATDAPPPEKGAAEVEAPEPEPDTLDYSIKVPITGADPVTLGELKDAYQARQAAVLDMVERENKVLRDLEKQQLLLSHIRNLPPDVAAAAEAEAVMDYQQQMDILKTTMPEMNTPEGARAVRDSLYRFYGKEYGVTKMVVDQIKSAVTIKIMHDYARLRESIQAAKSNVKPLRAEPIKAQQAAVTSSSTNALVERAKNSGHQADKIAAIDALLRSNK